MDLQQGNGESADCFDDGIFGTQHSLFSLPDCDARFDIDPSDAQFNAALDDAIASRGSSDPAGTGVTPAHDLQTTGKVL